jgi:hypothetical protein
MAGLSLDERLRAAALAYLQSSISANPSVPREC